ncbi:MAG: hypothetical protein ACYCZY_00645 [Lacisediminihabitans sp.]
MTDALDGVSTETEVSIRRAPKYPAFLIVGAGLGAVGTFVVTALYPADPAIGFAALFGYFALYGVPLGVMLGGFLAILLDRRATRRAHEVRAELVSVEEAERSGAS